MKKYTVIAYADEGHPRRERAIMALSDEQAWEIAWKIFPEYHEVGVFEEGGK